LLISASIPRPTLDEDTYFLRGKAIQSDARESEIVSVPINPNLPRFQHRGDFEASRDCRTVPIRTGSEACRTHQAVDEEGGAINPINLQIEFATGTLEWRLYLPIDGGPLTLVRQGFLKTPAIQAQLLLLQDPVFSPAGGEVCYFVQYFDEHGNGGPLKDLGCSKFTGKPPQTPVVARLQPLEIGGEKKTRLRWFCPTVGEERFEVRITQGPGEVPSDIKADLTHTGSTLVSVIDADGNTIVKQGKRFDTGIVGHTLAHNGPEFNLLIDVNPDVTYHRCVIAIGTNGLRSDVSNVVEFNWKTPEEIILPEVAWPAGPLPDETKAINWDSRIEAVFLANELDGLNRVGVRIGQMYGARVCTLGPDDCDPANPVFALPGNVDPLVPIFTQKNWVATLGNPLPPRLLPAMLYRYQVPNDLFDQVSNDIVQVTPLMESIAHHDEAPIGPPLASCSGTRIYDPHIAVTSSGRFGIVDGEVAFDIWLLDSMPVTLGARYAYLLVVFRENGEIRTAIPAGTVDISLTP
jgi:hypothetical protein